MYLEGLNEKERLKVKELCATVNISNEEAVRLLKENNWDLPQSSRRASASIKPICSSAENPNALIPCTSKDEICDWDRITSRYRVHNYAFYLPDLISLPNEFRMFLEKDLIETSTQRRLEFSRHLNWWNQFGQKLYPLSTTGDGNCLLHAASLGMWGVHDRQLTLRETLYEMLTNGTRKEALWRRWKWAEHNAIHSSELALTLSDDEWQQEWDGLVALASPIPRKQDDTSSNSTDQIYESLETIHVFALAHVLKRPIVVVSDTVLRNAKGEELSPVSFGGIYLPLECPPSQCHRSPLVLCYDSAHFSPLVPMRSDTTSMKQIIPIIDINRNLLPVHFALDPGDNFNWWKSENQPNHSQSESICEVQKLELISRYMDIIRLDIRRGSIRSTRRVRSAHAAPLNLPPAENPHGAASTAEKGMTLASSGISLGRHEKWRIINEITGQLMRTLRLSSNQKQKEKIIEAEDCISRMNSTCVLASELVPTHHEYMDVMVNEYMKSAKQRFQQNQKSATAATATSDGRKRISRSFSASSLMITCINVHCNAPASQATNFLCDECFAQHKMVLMSFNCEKLAGSSSNSSSNSQLANSGGIGQSSTLPTISANNSIDLKLLNIVTKDGTTTKTSVRAVTDENGIVRYFYDVANETPPKNID
ncbi:unnamed protein product [Caenorhabditis angaria]|uniref:ubiquitinyl hydrolase 1 n=1 Tax=Caenorhabditis angaria TaxID=860376 RepID=A0A9P1MU43_9PELO|nr:unnamed protein product [Caenorhabditis angaria]